MEPCGACLTWSPSSLGAGIGSASSNFRVQHSAALRLRPAFVSSCLRRTDKDQRLRCQDFGGFHRFRQKGKGLKLQRYQNPLKPTQTSLAGRHRARTVRSRSCRSARNPDKLATAFRRAPQNRATLSLIQGSSKDDCVPIRHFLAIKASTLAPAAHPPFRLMRILSNSFSLTIIQKSSTANPQS